MEDKFVEDKQAILDVYHDSIAQYGHTIRGITWGSSESQLIRFKIISQMGGMLGKRVLDVGCGFGDLYGYLAGSGARPSSYLGIDINSVVIETAKNKYRDAEFTCGDILLGACDNFKFDYVVASGALGISTAHWEEHTFSMLKKMWDLSEVGIAANFLTKFSKRRTGSNYVDPGWMLNTISIMLSRWTVLRQEYKENDFTIYVYHNSPF